MKNGIYPPPPQRGVTLLEMILVMALLAIATLMGLESHQAELEQAQARAVGLKLSQYNNAVRSLISKTPSLAAGQKMGSAWLKSTECGGPFTKGSEFLPCDFPAATVADPIKYGQLSINSTIDVAGTGSDKRITVTTLSAPFTVMESNRKKVRSDLSGLAAITAASATENGYSAGSSYNSNPADGRITMVANNKPDNDVWLRTDGSNKMHANLQFDNADPLGRQIVGASRIQNLAGQMLYLGAASGIAAVWNSGVVVDANTEIIGDVLMRRTLNVLSNASVSGSATVGGNVAASGNVTAAANVIAGGSVGASSNVTAGAAVMGQLFYDSNNTAFYLDPDKYSNLANLQTQSLYNTGAMTSLGRITANEYVDLNGIAYVGQLCPKRGLIASDANGKTLSCQDGVWKAGGGGSKVLTGFVTNGQQIPIPEGADPSSCTWSSASATNAHPGSRPDYAGGNYSIVGADRIVTCGFKDKGAVIAGGYCSFVISCEG
ncbi:prepilin-type N-terminal cleavage/methylation domain-containing protein [Pseudomonas sp. S1(2024)]|uniref:prepilin-type N-terminal cleavage/methylation domain-containing protein n=1 Tax=Pseudomonas sp. S1(2024) TaxID=3390191 RepID=UPI00397E0E0F